MIELLQFFNRNSFHGKILVLEEAVFGFHEDERRFVAFKTMQSNATWPVWSGGSQVKMKGFYSFY